MPASSKHTPAPPPALEVPRSAASFSLNLLGLAGGLGVIMALLQWGAVLDAWIGPLPQEMGTVAGNHLLVALVGCAVVFAIIGGGELLVRRSYRNAATGLAGKALRAPDYARVAVRLLGFVVTLGLIAAAYALFPEYHGSFYAPFWGFLQALLGPVALLIVPYFIWTDMRLDNPHDAYWYLGSKPWTAFNPGPDGAAVRSHLMGWTVKAFFLPLMVVYLSGEVGSLGNAYNAFIADPGPWYSRNWYQFLYDLSYMVDLLFCVVGYTITLRLFDSHIRSTEPTAFGWLIALVCYQPFYSTIGSMYLRYDDNLYWDNWLSTLTHIALLNNVLETVWGYLIVMLLFVYALSTVSFGLRFSNLTYRGVITAGPYRFTKHPAYISKNLSWWLISIPFISHEHWYEAIRNSILLGLLNLVYFLRARTEERHLSLRDPDYVAYALWMNQHGMLAWLADLLPFLRYKPPAGAAGTAAARA
jgi:protein-S-isoprenylcysteine O-methyltransferase Ste14